jgi:hypothetical protein
LDQLKQFELSWLIAGLSGKKRAIGTKTQASDSRKPFYSLRGVRRLIIAWTLLIFILVRAFNSKRSLNLGDGVGQINSD